MNRDALLVYLRDLRDLEVEKYRIIREIKHNLEQKRQVRTRVYQELLGMNELQRVTLLLADAYRNPILVPTYRNLASVYYIYEKMSQSQESLGDILMREHMENGIEKLEEKLDRVLTGTEDTILWMRRRESREKKAVERTMQMLQGLKKALESQPRTKQSILEISQYAGICETYRRTNDFFAEGNAEP